MNHPNVSAQILRNLPAILEARRLVAEELVTQRRELLAGLVAAQQHFDTETSALAAKAKPLEQKLDALRTQIEQIHQQLKPLQAARQTAESVRAHAVDECTRKLRATAQTELFEFQVEIEDMRSEIGNNFSGKQGDILRMFRPDRPMQHRITEAMSVTLEAFRQAQRAVVEAEDFTAALHRIRQELRAAGIEVAAA
jgi:uncharacterized phage infection (PIP) family protein YhgE